MHEIHFAHAAWAYLLLIIPLVCMAYFLFYREKTSSKHLEKFIDPHLLPHLIVEKGEKKSSSWKTLLAWSLCWSCLSLALAGPRWSYREIETFSKDQSLVILLDLSESMNATDIKPTRLIRAKQKIEDLLNHLQGVKVGLIAFAADPHMISPITDDKETIIHLLPSLNSDLVYVQGSQIASALALGARMLEQEHGSNKALLVISDGGFEDTSVMTTLKTYQDKGMFIHTMGMGTQAGAPLHAKDGTIYRKEGVPVILKLEKEKLMEMARLGGGHYLEPSYPENPEAIIANSLELNAKAQEEKGKKIRLWDEGFYLFLLPVLPIMLWWFRRGSLFALFFLFSQNLNAGYFQNSEERGKELFDQEDYETAATTFQDPYHKGVAEYRAGNFEAAEKSFQQSKRGEVATSAAYNLGNARAHQNKLKEAIEAYEHALSLQPDHKQAKENLELLKKMLEEQSQDQNNDQDQQPDPQPNQAQDQNGSEPEPSTSQKDKKNDAPQNSSSNKEASSLEEQEAEFWLNQLTNDPKQFLQNKFYIESKKNGATKGVDPW